MNKAVILFFAAVFSIAGSLLPNLWGDGDFFGVASILWSVIGGIIGISIGVWISKRWLSV